MKISVLSPNYNHGRFLAQNINGVLAQTHKNWELILVDDGSTDDSAAIIRDFAARDPRIKPIFFPANKGVMPAAIAAHKAASGDLLFGCAIDDYICNPNFFSTAVTSLRKRPAAGFFGCASVVDPDTLAEKWVMGNAPQEGYLPAREAMIAFLHSKLFVPGVSAIWKRSFFDECGGYDPDLGPQCDYYINHALPALGGVIFSKTVMTVSRLFPSSYSQAVNDEEFFRRHALVEKKLRSLHTKYPIEKEWFNTWRFNLINGRLGVVRQKNFITSVRQTIGNIETWEFSVLPQDFVACREQLLKDCDALEKNLNARLAAAEEILGG